MQARMRWTANAKMAAVVLVGVAVFAVVALGVVLGGGGSSSAATSSTSAQTVTGQPARHDPGRGYDRSGHV